MSKKIKDPAESVVIDFDFSSELTAVDSASVAVFVHGAALDPDLTSFLEGPHQISGTHVFQRISGGIRGMKYRVECLAKKTGGDSIIRKDVIHIGLGLP